MQGDTHIYTHKTPHSWQPFLRRLFRVTDSYSLPKALMLLGFVCVSVCVWVFVCLQSVWMCGCLPGKATAGSLISLPCPPGHFSLCTSALSRSVKELPPVALECGQHLGHREAFQRHTLARSDIVQITMKNQEFFNWTWTSVTYPPIFWESLSPTNPVRFFFKAH